MAMCAIAQHFGRPGTPTDQAWIESLFSHVKADWPHLDAIRDPAVLRAELAVVRVEYDTVRLHAGIGYVTPDDEHEGRGPKIRRARRVGRMRARRQRIAYHRLQARGVPRQLYVDNGAPFVSGQLARVCAVLGIGLTHSAPGRPQGRGKIERFCVTTNVARRIDVEDRTELVRCCAGDGGAGPNRAGGPPRPPCSTVKANRRRAADAG